MYGVGSSEDTNTLPKAIYVFRLLDPFLVFYFEITISLESYLGDLARIIDYSSTCFSILVSFWYFGD